MASALYTDATNVTHSYSVSTNSKDLAIHASDIVSIFYVVIGTLGILGNLTVIVVFASNSKLRKTFVNMYIMNQCCIDSIVSVTVIGLTGFTSKALNNNISGTIYCLFWQSRVLMFGFMTSSTYNLLCLTVERYAGVVHPIWHKVHLTHTKVIISMAGAWTFGFLTEAVQKLSTAHLEDGQCIVYFAWPSSEVKAVYGTLILILKLLFPFGVLIYCYIRIALVIQKKIDETVSKTNHGLQSQSQQQRLSKGHSNTIKTLFSVAVCFAICWTWNQINFYRQNLGYYIDLTSNSYHVTVILVYLNCCVNPFIYAFKYQQFQVRYVFSC